MLITNASQLPNLKDAKSLAFDLETTDPDLKTLGPGVRRDGKVLGIAMGTDDRQAWYVSLGHETHITGNVCPEKAWDWVSDCFTQKPDRPVLGASLDYDLDYALENGCPMPGVVRDVLHGARLLEMQAWYPNLDYALREHLGQDMGKTGDDLWVWIATHRGKGKPTRKDQIGHLAMAPAEMVAEYAEGDVRLLADLMNVLEVKLKERSAWDWFLVECQLLPYLLRMRRRGVRVDVEKAGRLQSEFGDEYRKLYNDLGHDVYGDEWKGLNDAGKKNLLNENTAASLEPVYAKQGITVPRTETGAPSVTKPWLEEQEDPTSKAILKLRALSKISGTFVESYILKHQVNGRIHPTIKQLFPRTLRTSSENPNGQNIPSRDEILAPMIRGLFLPEEGEDWGRHDYDQQEYRLLVNYAVGQGAQEARDAYNNDPSTNFHKLVHSWLPQVPAYKTVKNANFAKTYRSGKAVFAKTLGVPRSEGDEIFALYDQQLPFVKATGELAEKIAKQRGFTKTLLCDFRMYFDRWAIDDWDFRNAHRDEKDGEPRKTAMGKLLFASWKTPEELREAVAGALPDEDWGRLRVGKADTYKALNRVIQPSGAQMIKKAMTTISDKILGPALLMIHDELDFSIPRTLEGRQAFAEVARVMTEADGGKMKVPLTIGTEVGPNWGNLTEIPDLDKWVNEMKG